MLKSAPDQIIVLFFFFFIQFDNYVLLIVLFI